MPPKRQQGNMPQLSTVVIAIIVVVISIVGTYIYEYTSVPEIFESAYEGDLNQLLETAIVSSKFSSEKISSIEMDNIIATLLVTPKEAPSQVSNYICSSRDSFGNTLLHWASKGNSIPVISYLLSLPCTDVNAINNNGSSALHWASTIVGPEEVYEVMNSTAVVERGRDIDSTSNTDMADSIDDASDSTNIAIVGSVAKPVNPTIEMLIASGASLAKTNNNGETALHWAVEWQSVMSVRSLIYHNASVVATDIHLNQPLHKINADCHTIPLCAHIVALMVVAGAPAADKNEFGRSAMQHFDTGFSAPSISDEEDDMIMKGRHVNYTSDLNPQLRNNVKTEKIPVPERALNRQKGRQSDGHK